MYGTHFFSFFLLCGDGGDGGDTGTQTLVFWQFKV